jgi:hypothetical protein
MGVAIVDAATFTVKKRIPMIASATVPGYVDMIRRVNVGLHLVAI